MGFKRIDCLIITIHIFLYSVQESHFEAEGVTEPEKVAEPGVKRKKRSNIFEHFGENTDDSDLSNTEELTMPAAKKTKRLNILEHCGEEELVKEKPNDSKTKKVAKEQKKNEIKTNSPLKKFLELA